MCGSGRRTTIDYFLYIRENRSDQKVELRSKGKRYREANFTSRISGNENCLIEEYLL